MEEEDIGDVQMLFVNEEGKDSSFLFTAMTDEEMPDNIQGDWFEMHLFMFVLGVLVDIIVWV